MPEWRSVFVHVRHRLRFEARVDAPTLDEADAAARRVFETHLDKTAGHAAEWVLVRTEQVMP